MDYRDPETARRRSIFHQRIQIGFPGRSFVVDLQSYFSSLLGGKVKDVQFFVHRAEEILIPARASRFRRSRLKLCSY
ncbi:hypothetical protein DGN07_17125 [Xanthomonas citri pv. fuscans]|nr:hypothetical protein DGN07_17125 [Xanthomonas citri pv. fuscans]